MDNGILAKSKIEQVDVIIRFSLVIIGGLLFYRWWQLVVMSLLYF